MDENKEAWNLYRLLQGQQILGFGEKCGPLDYGSVDFIFKIYKPKNRKETLEKILMLHDIYAQKVNDG